MGKILYFYRADGHGGSAPVDAAFLTFCNNTAHIWEQLSISVDTQTRKEVYECLRLDKKIFAIKALRDKYELGLKAAKEATEAMQEYVEVSE